MKKIFVYCLVILGFSQASYASSGTDEYVNAIGANHHSSNPFTGPTGPPGPRGHKGHKGHKGDTGPAGLSFTNSFGSGTLYGNVIIQDDAPVAFTTLINSGGEITPIAGDFGFILESPGPHNYLINYGFSAIQIGIFGLFRLSIGGVSQLDTALAPVAPFAAVHNSVVLNITGPTTLELVNNAGSAVSLRSLVSGTYPTAYLNVTQLD